MLKEVRAAESRTEDSLAETLTCCVIAYTASFKVEAETGRSGTWPDTQMHKEEMDKSKVGAFPRGGQTARGGPRHPSKSSEKGMRRDEAVVASQKSEQSLEAS